MCSAIENLKRKCDLCESRRGGGAKGRSWWDAGRRTEKQHSFDDFAACADYLSDSGLTSPSRLAIIVRARCWAFLHSPIVR